MKPIPSNSKIMIIGAGPIVIGQACEFDYSGCQACKVLKERGFRTVLFNSNPATIMTDPEMADAVYMEPMTVEICEAVIAKEKPNFIIPTMGGQTALNLAVQLAKTGVLKRHGVQLLGATLEAIELAESRDKFKSLVDGLGFKTLKSTYVKSLRESLQVLDLIPFPLILRPSFTLGGQGGTVVYSEDEFLVNIRQALDLSPVGEVLVERSCMGWKEIELELMKDGYGNSVVVCGIENLDPMGVHTGDSITVAPLQTVSDTEYQAIRNQGLRILDALGIQTGGANIQFCQDPETGEFYVIEVNPRVSRSSALASKATGFPIAKIATLVAVGERLDQVMNDITQKTPVSFEPALDYVVVKIPKFNFEKFPSESKTLGISMKAIGETMAIGRNFEEALLKGLRSIEQHDDPLGSFLDKHHSRLEKMSDEELKHYLGVPNPDRLYYVFVALYRGMSIFEISDLTKISLWFLQKISDIVRLESFLKEETSPDLLEKAQQIGVTQLHMKRLNPKIPYSLETSLSRVDTCAAEFQSYTPYLYSSHSPSMDDSALLGKDPKPWVAIIGSGPNQIGQGLEFDYTCVHAAQAFNDVQVKPAIFNNNPETVSTDYDTADALFFEPLTPEAVIPALRQIPKLKGCLVMMGGQSAIHMAGSLKKHNIPLLGTQLEAIDICEDRHRFRKLIKKCRLRCPSGISIASPHDLGKIGSVLQFPVIVRPSYVIGGTDVQVFFNAEDLSTYTQELTKRPVPSFPLMAESFLENAQEFDCDLVRDESGNVVIAGIMEHVEPAGIHSGDSTAVFPHFYASPETIDIIEQATLTIAGELRCVGLLNIQFAVKNGELYVLEINPRASRTIPFLSKATGFAFAKIAAQVVLGNPLTSVFQFKGPCFNLNKANIPFFSVKKPIFPFDRFQEADIILGPQMKSTGEVIGIGKNFYEAYEKALIASGNPIPNPGATCFVSFCDEDKGMLKQIVEPLIQQGYKVVSTEGTWRHLKAQGIETTKIFKRQEGHPNVLDLVSQHAIQFIFNTTRSKHAKLDELHIRRIAVRYKVPYCTNLAEMQVISKLILSRYPHKQVFHLREYHSTIRLGERKNGKTLYDALGQAYP
jgi:carbamoyl-phosphate synthase large subunit